MGLRGCPQGTGGCSEVSPGSVCHMHWKSPQAGGFQSSVHIWISISIQNIGRIRISFVFCKVRVLVKVTVPCSHLRCTESFHMGPGAGGVVQKSEFLTDSGDSNA